MSVDLSLSRAYHEDAARIIAGGVNSNVRMGGTIGPLCFERAEGAYLTDIDGNRYIDYSLGMGPTVLGHAPKRVIDAVARSLANGQLFSGQSRAELELARRMQAHVPAAERIRIGMTGSEMVQAGLRLARASTGRTKFIKFAGHYHGWFDNVLANETGKGLSEGQAPNALADTIVLTWNDLDVLRTQLARSAPEIAAVIMEPVMCNTGVIPPEPGYLEGVRDLCDQYGIVLIIDEVVTGFRLGLSGAQGLFGIRGDLAVYAKAMGGGVPIAALTGREALMARIGSGAVNHSGTYNANVLSLVAALATLDALAADDGAAYARIQRAGSELIEGLRELAVKSGESLIVQGYPSVFNTAFGEGSSIRNLADYQRCDAARQRRFLDELLARGIRPTSRGTWFVSAAHAQHEVNRTLAAAHDALRASR